MRSLAGADETGVEQAILRELLRGNVPDSLRRMARIDFNATTRGGVTRAVTLWVARDYLSIGSDADSVRMPMSPLSAQLVCDRLGGVLPTPKMVDIIYRLAAVKLAPQPFPPTAWMVRPGEALRHSEAIDEQLRGVEGAAGALVAGHKKDIVLSNVLEQRPHRLAIYGWHTDAAHPIQPVTTGHGDWYSDYSQGARLVGGVMLIDGETHSTAEVLRDEELASLLCDEGALLHTRYRTEDGPGRTQWWPALPEGEAPPSGKPAAR